MNYSTYRITLDVRKTVSNVQLTAKKGDAGRKVYITLSDKGKPCEIADGLYAVFAGVKPDGTLLYNKTTIENNTIIYEMTQQTTAVPGLVACEVKLFDSMSNLLTSPKLTILVDDVVVPDEEIVSQNEITALAELILDATVSSNFATEAANAAIAAAVDAQAATESANGAAANANQAAEGANTAASNANTAAGKAMTEASKATQATDSANLATTKANNAASDARAAAEEANTARENFVQTTGEILASLSNAVYAPPIECLATGDVVVVNDASNQLLHGLHIYGKTTQDGTPTPEAPVELVSAGTSGAIKTTVAGKNLFDRNEVVAGSIAEDGTILDIANAFTSAYIPVTPGKHYYLSATMSHRGKYFNADKVVVSNKFDFYAVDGIKLTIPNGVHFLRFTYVTLADIQLELGNAATEFEPYNGQTLTASTPNGLPGIPVSSGGNYTDESGQQWICDEIDFARGVYVQRVAAKEMDGTTVLSRTGTCEFFSPLGAASTAYSVTDAQCSHFVYNMGAYGNGELGFVTTNGNLTFRYPGIATDTADAFKAFLAEQANAGNPVTVRYVLKAPIETALSAEELAQYAALHTNKPNTTVYNDAGAGLAVEYVADTKNYIDQKLAAISAALLNA